mgnify:CR=1 FL=1
MKENYKNNLVRNLYRGIEPNVIGYVKAQRGRWLGHLKRENASIENTQNDFDKHNRREKEKRKTQDKMEHRSNKKYSRPWYYQLGR